MKLKFTRKTWYFFLLAGCGASMLNAMAVLTGTEWAFLEMVSFCITAIATLFLAAERDNSSKEKGRYFLVFVLLMLSYLINGWAGYLGAALAWPVLLAVERADTDALYQAVISGQEEIERKFAEAMGDLLRDGYWSNTAYAPGQEELLYLEASEFMEA